jgi:hypothetical protein
MTASALLKLREWLSLEEAADELSTRLGDLAKPADVLRLALDDHLKLSVILPPGTEAMSVANDGEEEPTVRRPVDGLWDLPMIAAGRQHVEHEINRLRGHRWVSMANAPGAEVERRGERCQLLADRGGPGLHRNLAPALPQGYEFAVRRAALDEAVAEMGKSSSGAQSGSVEQPLAERERTTLLVIIAALAKAAEIDISRPSKAAGQIEALTIEHQARVSARTVEEKLKRIPDALERRAKTSD